MINTLQIITHLPLVSIAIPSNLQMFISVVSDISNLNVLPKDTVKSILGKIVDLNTKSSSSANKMDIF